MRTSSIRPPTASEARGIAVSLFHLHVRNISRGDGRSAVACAAYRAGDTLPNEVEEKASAFGGRRDVVFAEIRVPIGAAGWMRERASLWNGVERAEKRKDARLAKEIEFSLPRLLPRAEWLGLARQMADAYTARGHIVDLAIHDNGSAHNPHVHLLLTTRAIGDDGFGPKLREADGRQFVQEARSTWAKIANAALGAAGFAPIDPRSHAARGITDEPGQHHGPDRAARRERREEGLRMGLDEELITARNELVAAAGIRERYPVLSARADWPPEQRQVTGYLPPEAKAEHDRFWREVHQRALEPERAGDEAGAIERGEVVRGTFAGDIETLVATAATADAQTDILERHMAFEDARTAFAGIRDRMVTEMVRAGLMDPRTAEHVRMIEQKLYPDEFSRIRAEAQRIYAKRHEVGQMPQPTPAMLRQAAALERAEFESRGVAFEPPKHQPAVPPAPDVPTVRQGFAFALYTPIDSNDPVPDPDGRPISEPELHQAEDRMVAEVEQPTREVPQPPAPERAPEVERQLAEAAVERQNTIEVPEIVAESYRMAPQEDRLDWLQALSHATDEDRQSQRALERTEDRLDWLKVTLKPPSGQDEEIRHEPDRYQR